MDSAHRSLISPLSLQECLSRLEEARKKQTDPIHWNVSSRTFTLKKQHEKLASQMRGELSGFSRGTVITCSMETEAAVDKLNSLWFVGAIPLLMCVALGLLLNGFLNGFSKELVLIILLVSAFPAFYFLRRQLGIRQLERDQQEMLDLVQETLDAKPGLP